MTVKSESAVLRDMRIAWVLAWSMLLVAGACAQEPADTDAGPEAKPAPNQAVVHYVQKEMWIPAPQSFPNGLDSIEVYANLPGKHPLVVLTHGTSDKEEEREHVTPWGQLGQAMWFARRGYVAIVVARRGYGRSGGQRDGTNGGCNQRGGSFEQAGEASADDLRAVIKFARTLPEVDGETAVSIGISTGGFAQVALSADPPKELKAAINFAGGRGGDGHEHNCNLNDLIAAFGAFGRGAKKHGDLPMLWIYAENDHWFTPAMARQFEAAYDKGGGAEQFVLAPPDRDEGHHLYSHISAWSGTVEAFLKAHNLLPLGDQLLPAPQPPKSPPPPDGLPDAGKEAWGRYLLGAPYKAFATNGQAGWGLSLGAFDQSIANSDAIDRCKKSAGSNGSCSIVAKTPGVK